MRAQGKQRDPICKRTVTLPARTQKLVSTITVDLPAMSQKSPHEPDSLDPTLLPTEMEEGWLARLLKAFQGDLKQLNVSALDLAMLKFP